MGRRTKRADGRYAVSITLPQPGGTKRRAYFYGRTQAEAKASPADARERVNQGGPVRDTTQRLSDWLGEWQTTFLQASDRAESTKHLYAGLTARHVEPLIGHLPLSQVKPSDITRGACCCRWRSGAWRRAPGGAPTGRCGRPSTTR